MDELLEKIEIIRKKHEFLTFLIESEDVLHCGIVQNINKRFITFYSLNKVPTGEMTELFYSYGDKWWWESGMLLPIDCYIGRDFDVFQQSLTILPKKALAVDPIGPTYSIANQYLKRVKKRRIDLVS